MKSLSKRDWGHAKDYVVMWLIMQNNKADDFVIATGKQYSIKRLLKLLTTKNEDCLEIKVLMKVLLTIVLLLKLKRYFDQKIDFQRRFLKQKRWKMKPKYDFENSLDMINENS